MSRAWNKSRAQAGSVLIPGTAGVRLSGHGTRIRSPGSLQLIFSVRRVLMNATYAAVRMTRSLEALKTIYNPHYAPPLPCNDNSIVHTRGCRPFFCHANPPENFRNFFSTVRAVNPPAGTVRYVANKLIRLIIPPPWFLRFRTGPACKFLSTSRPVCFHWLFSGLYTLCSMQG